MISQPYPVFIPLMECTTNERRSSINFCSFFKIKKIYKHLCTYVILSNFKLRLKLFGRIKIFRNKRLSVPKTKILDKYR